MLFQDSANELCVDYDATQPYMYLLVHLTEKLHHIGAKFVHWLNTQNFKTV